MKISMKDILNIKTAMDAYDSLRTYANSEEIHEAHMKAIAGKVSMLMLMSELGLLNVEVTE